MQQIITVLERIVSQLASLCIPLIQLLGVLVLVVSAGKCVYDYARRRKGIAAKLARGMALALEFMLGAEVLHIVNAHEWQELGVLGIGVLIHCALTLLLHKEVKEGEKHDD